MGGASKARGVGWERVRFRRRREVARRRGGEGCVVKGVREQRAGRALGSAVETVVR